MIRLATSIILILGFVCPMGISAETRLASASRSEPPRYRRKAFHRYVPFETVEKGVSSGITSREGLVIKDEGRWLELWERHTKNQVPEPPIPRIDFQDEMIVAVFSGQKPNAGYAITVDRIRESDDSLVVVVDESKQGRGTINAMMISQPFHIVRLARNDIPVIFQGI